MACASFVVVCTIGHGRHPDCVVFWFAFLPTYGLLVPFRDNGAAYGHEPR